VKKTAFSLAVSLLLLILSQSTPLKAGLAPERLMLGTRPEATGY